MSSASEENESSNRCCACTYPQGKWAKRSCWLVVSAFVLGCAVVDYYSFAFGITSMVLILRAVCKPRTKRELKTAAGLCFVAFLVAILHASLWLVLGPVILMILGVFSGLFYLAASAMVIYIPVVEDFEKTEQKGSATEVIATSAETFSVGDEKQAMGPAPL